MARPSSLEALLDEDHSAWTTQTDPSLPLLEVTTQLSLMSLMCSVFEPLAVKGPSLKGKAGTMKQFL